MTPPRRRKRAEQLRIALRLPGRSSGAEVLLNKVTVALLLNTFNKHHAKHHAVNTQSTRSRHASDTYATRKRHASDT